MAEASFVRILDVDPDLASELDPEALATARRYAVAEVTSLQPGPWCPYVDESERSGHLGYLVVEGLLERSARMANSACAELLGKGDILRPWQEDCGWAVARYQVEWQVLQPTHIAILDRRFAAVACRWPEIIDVVLGRMVHRTRCLAFHMAISHLTRVDDRILATFWYLANRWGRVTSDGVALSVRLTHQKRRSPSRRPTAVGDHGIGRPDPPGPHHTTPRRIVAPARMRARGPGSGPAVRPAGALSGGRRRAGGRQAPFGRGPRP